MKSNAAVVGLLLAATVLLAACVGTPNPDALKIEFTTDPAQLTVGVAKLIVVVKDKDNKPVEGADVRISYSMTTMNMVESSGRATEQGGGRYVIFASFTHAGSVRVVVHVDKPGLSQGTSDFTMTVR